MIVRAPGIQLGPYMLVLLVVMEYVEGRLHGMLDELDQNSKASTVNQRS
jgi:hypothetical protein